MDNVALVVHPDEPAHGLEFRIASVPMAGGGQQRRWIQSVAVIRGDAKTWHHTDYGPPGQWEHVAPLTMPSFGDDSVAQLEEEADRHRATTFPREHLEKVRAESTLMQDVVNQMEERSEDIHNRSIIGPHITKQRDEFSQERAQRILKERMHA